MYETRCKREAGESCRRINCLQKPRKVHLAPVPRRYNGVFYSWFHAPQPNRIAESLALPQKDHDASPAPRTDALTADDKGVTGDVIDREVSFPLSSRHFGGCDPVDAVCRLPNTPPRKPRSVPFPPRRARPRRGDPPVGNLHASGERVRRRDTR